MKRITSRNNPLIKKIVALHKTKQRKTAQQFIAEGIRTCSTLINAGYQPITLYVIDTMLDYAKQFTNEEKIILVDATVMKKNKRCNYTKRLAWSIYDTTNTKSRTISYRYCLGSDQQPG